MAEVATASESVNKGNKNSSQDNDEIHFKLKTAMRSRIPHFLQESDSLTLEGVRRVLERDLELDEFSLDIHKRFIKECLEECLKRAANENTSKNSGETNVSSARQTAESANGKESNDHINEPESEVDEKMEDSPILGLLTGHKTSEYGKEDTQSVNDEVVLNESTIKKAIWKRASYIRANLETLSMAGLRRLLEEDFKLETRAIDTYRDFISEELDKVLQPPQPSESKTVGKKKGVKKSDSDVSERDRSEESSESSGSQSDEEDEVTPKKKIVSKRKTHSSEGIKKRKRPENDAKSSKKNVKSKKTKSEDNSDDIKSKKTKSEDNSDDNDSVVDSEDDNSQSSDEKPAKKKEVLTPAYGKHAERLKSVIKACGMSVPPNIYKKVKQAPEGKRKARLIKELEEILSREGLSSSPSEKEIKEVRKRKEKAKELEGIDSSNIISSSRRQSRRSFIPPPNPKLPDVSDSEDSDDDEEDDDNNEDNSEGEVPNEDEEDSD